MNEQTINLIQSLANKLGTTAEQLIELYTNQALVEFISSAIIVPIFGIAFIICMYIAYKAMQTDGFEDGERVSIFKFLTSLIIGLVSGLISFTGLILTPWITLIANPKFWAVQQIIKNLTGTIN